ncbi:YifB family Mg chelatase-like AAA ATPase [Bacillus sp. V3B]|uniref:YifB family Mg chelatase-like AAA ATPase n=1 Tax=Bacillus sp. V3B TaxID=2804915 RepID=UPI00210D3D16|nr:YifB family Mg chelatase-like AAA ATPase [Bacillus sp. V3B]MCQ6276820.1 YifB family Mg chelatase-like AAA ATPase [Bacillus sp. V3B]
MASTVHSFTLSGIEGHVVEVETDVLFGPPSVSIVGLGDKAIKEARERLEAAIVHSKLIFPPQKIVFNLAPSDMKKTGTHFDLAMAIGLLVRTNQIHVNTLLNIGFIGELSLNASIRPVSGILPMVIKAKETHITTLIVAKENVAEAQLVTGLNIFGCSTLREAIDLLEGKVTPISNQPTPSSTTDNLKHSIDFSEVKGHELLIEYIAIAAAGGHNLLLIGPPGCGKTMIAKRIPTILPKMVEEEALQVMRVYSVANQLKIHTKLLTERPFRSPHHNASINALIGGGSYALPGEISLAHHGVLFLDEIAEFTKKALDAMRQPLEDGTVTISRVWGSNTYPASFMLVGAMNPCPCGYFGGSQCRCTDYEVLSYRKKISGPILDRMDIQKYVGVVDFFNLPKKGKSSLELRDHIERARLVQIERYKDIPDITCNAQLSPSLIEKFCPLDDDSLNLLRKAAEHFHYSGRTIHKYIKIARTIADLENEPSINASHMKKSLLSRDLEKDNHALQRKG